MRRRRWRHEAQDRCHIERHLTRTITRLFNLTDDFDAYGGQMAELSPHFSGQLGARTTDRSVACAPDCSRNWIIAFFSQNSARMQSLMMFLRSSGNSGPSVILPEWRALLCEARPASLL